VQHQLPEQRTDFLERTTSKHCIWLKPTNSFHTRTAVHLDLLPACTYRPPNRKHRQILAKLHIPLMGSAPVRLDLTSSASTLCQQRPGFRRQHSRACQLLCKRFLHIVHPASTQPTPARLAAPLTSWLLGRCVLHMAQPAGAEPPLPHSRRSPAVALVVRQHAREGRLGLVLRVRLRHRHSPSQAARHKGSAICWSITPGFRTQQKNHVRS
jgi:hypothetical protein